MNRSMNKRCGVWCVWLPAMVLCLGSLAGVATADEQDAAEKTGEATAPPLAVAPFDAAAAKAHQEAWAKHLGVPVEYENSIGMKFVLIPPGEFDMGSPEEEVDELSEAAIFRSDWYMEKLRAEVPKHRVRITKAFYLGMTEVTQTEYDRVMADNASEFKGDPTRPAEMVSWYDAVGFCHRLARVSEERVAHSVYRLPTEAEWEYACRAGTTTRWYATDDEAALQEQAWFAANSDGTTHPVGQKLPNAWGLYDMHGNVWEWCADWYDAANYANSPVDDPQGPDRQGRTAHSTRVCRGGYWNSIGTFCRSANRYTCLPTIRANYLGFRVAFSWVDQSIKGTALQQSEPQAVSSVSEPLPPWDLLPGSPPPAIGPFDTDQAKQHQTAWAEHLGVPLDHKNSIGMKFALIPPGEFDMGTPEGDPSASGRRHRVRITKAFYLGMTQVTQAEYQRVVGRNPSRFKGDPMRPVELVSWDDVVAFCQKLAELPEEKEGNTVYRLPTEAEWEYACKAGTTRRFFFGDNVAELGDYAWYSVNSDGTTHPVGQKLSNAWGLYDMHGNVWEWCADWYDAANYANSPVDDPQGPSTGSHRVLRGGSWIDKARQCWSASRYRYHPFAGSQAVGFRVIFSSAEQSVQR